MSVAAYMEAALTHPEYGYYMHARPVGAQGAFTTAPEISQFFGEIIGVWCAHAWQSIEMPPQCLLMEAGPGRGTLMADLLRATRHVVGFHEALEVRLVEVSPVLRQEQARALSAYPFVTWEDAFFSEIAAPSILIANEFLDALPVRQFERMAEGWHERLVGWSEAQGLHWAVAQEPDEEAEKSGFLPQGAEIGAIAEYCPQALALSAKLAEMWRASGQPGVALFIDYGFEVGYGDTLQAVRRHRYHPVLARPGEADITAHVDFGALGRAAQACGLQIWGPVSQAHFLGALGVAQRCEAMMSRADPEQKEALLSGFRRLVDPEQMGRLFKVMALASPDMPLLEGFAKERSGRL